MKRVRLLFEGKGFALGELQKCWFLVPTTLNTVNDLAYHLLQKFDLPASATKHGLTLSVDDFVLPPSQSVELIRDNDSITVRLRETIARTTTKAKVGNGVEPKSKKRKIQQENDKREPEQKKEERQEEEEEEAEESSSSEEEEEEGESSSSSESEEEASSSSSSSSSEESEDEKTEAMEGENDKSKEKDLQQAATLPPPSTPIPAKGHIVFQENGHVSAAQPPALNLNIGHGRGRGRGLATPTDFSQPPPTTPPSSSRGRGRGGGRGGRGTYSTPTDSNLTTNLSPGILSPPPPRYNHYQQQQQQQQQQQWNQFQQPQHRVSASTKDYSNFPIVDIPKKGDRIAYTILEIQNGCPVPSGIKVTLSLSLSLSRFHTIKVCMDRKRKWFLMTEQLLS
ncbi:DNA-directed RNA polymerase I subunit RPA34.5-domain-containing protein, variant 2 [Balamuthia mandrillaris]